MYIVEFLQKDQSKTFKKFLRKNKAGNGKQLGLRMAEELIQRYIEQNQQNDKVALLLQDIENEKAYEFELPVEVSEKFSLLTAISNDLEKGVEFHLGMEIKQGIYTSYQSEEKQVEIEQEVENPKKKKGGFLAKFFGKKEEEVEKNNTSNEMLYDGGMQKEFTKEAEDPFAEMSVHEMQGQGANVFEDADIQGLQEQAAALAEENEKDPFAIEDELNEQLPTGVNLEKENEDLENTVIENDPVQSLEELLYTDLEKKEPTEESIVEVQTKDVEFPEYSQFVDLREVEEKQKRYDSRFTVKHLLGLLGISEETAETDLEKKKLHYVKNVLSGKEFLLIQDRYYQDINNLRDEIRLALENIHKEVMMRDYQKEAEERLQEIFEENFQRKVEELDGFENKENQEMQQKINAYRDKQQLELESFKLQQEAELTAYSSELEERKNTLISAREEELKKENDIEQKKAIVEKVYELKIEGKNDLIDKKSMYVSEYTDAVEDIMNAAYEQQEVQFTSIENEIKELTPVWKEEIQAEHDKKMEERQLRIKEDKTKLEQDTLALEQRKQQALEVKRSERESELLKLVEDLKDQLIKAHGNTGQQPQQQMYMYAPPVVQQQPVYMYQQPVMQQQPIQPQAAQQPVMPSQTESNPKKRRSLLEFWYKNEK
ncbi:hypothetical protein [Bacillus thuringiensis]|uniref:Uncharacterized protein n=1 Tax=Bacillus thuringiensis TaxID=1428 RepID=A0A9X6V5W4_BACTU|nr:hypothetical protein [Bacillus thuringiensis]MCU5280033.1 hypothetical protein [Bacillus cereus]KIP26990.1 hypothetical protein BG10_1757 [Bacillus thuringiensis serovar morrisoni]MBG9638208.1 hypothetical protein [Bacillus thuringiensis]MBG9674428.1 hypothetical protein [Bacillus thuringiensis]MCT6946531.1 hypothetical protein [Bacillus thuringiensis]